MVSSGKATLRDLTEYYSLEDMYLLLELTSVDAHNQKILADEAKRKMR